MSYIASLPRRRRRQTRSFADAPSSVPELSQNYNELALPQMQEQVQENNHYASPYVYQLTPENFDEFLEQNPNNLCAFTTNWCSHCKEMAPEYVAAAQEAQDNELEFKFAAIDCAANEANEAFCRKQKINSYPTIKYMAGQSKQLQDY